MQIKNLNKLFLFFFVCFFACHVLVLLHGLHIRLFFFCINSVAADIAINLNDICLLQESRSKSQISPSKEHSEWRTRACCPSRSDLQKSTDRSAKDTASRFSTVRSLCSNQTLLKTSSSCEYVCRVVLHVERTLICWHHLNSVGLIV